VVSSADPYGCRYYLFLNSVESIFRVEDGTEEFPSLWPYFPMSFFFLVSFLLYLEDGGSRQ
jgi:hypothetical protein